MEAGTILAIDTSSATASVAVYRDQVLAELSWHADRRHSAELLRAIDQGLDLSGVKKGELSMVAVAAGPGSYSGLRVGASTGMGIALALGIKVVQVPTLDALAWAQSANGADRTIRAAIDVGRGHYGSARFRRTKDQLEHETRVETVELDELLEMAKAEHALLVVDLDPAARENVERQYGPQIDLATPAASIRRAAFVAELAAMKLRHGEAVGSSVVEPIYLH